LRFRTFPDLLTGDRRIALKELDVAELLWLTSVIHKTTIGPYRLLVHHCGNSQQERHPSNCFDVVLHRSASSLVGHALSIVTSKSFG
jgi:hypothetical protein